MSEGERSIEFSESDGKEDGDRPWAKVVQGSSRAPVWSSYKLMEELDRLQQSFSTVLVMPGPLLDDSR